VITRFASCSSLEEQINARSTAIGRSREQSRPARKPLLCLAILPLGFVGLLGCSKALTESRAVGIVQRYVDAQGGGVVTTSIGELTNQLGREFLQTLHQRGVQRLVHEGYIEQRVVTVPYPNFSGDFTGSHSVWGPGEIVTNNFNLQTVAEIPPREQGSFRTCFLGTCYAGSVSGLIQRMGPSTLRLKEQGPMGRSESLVVSLVRGQPDALVGTYNESSGWGTSIRAVGRITGPDIQQEVYVYAWTDKLPKDALHGAVLTLGHLEVDSCEQLLLDTETSASANCKTHVDLTKAARVIFGSGPTEQIMRSVFGKQPDGTWVATQVIYPAPQYSINR
jgi:hypothetical protein